MKKRQKPVNRIKQTIGKWGENIAALFLTKQGYAVTFRNVRTPQGEIDLIAEKGNELVFVEVKTRTSTTLGYPEEAVTDAKLEHMVNSAEWYIDQHPELGENWRIDVISIIGKMGWDEPQIEWFQNAA
jgi:putative endonuclease